MPLLAYSDRLLDVASSYSFAEIKNVLSRGQITSSDLPLDMNKQLYNDNSTSMIIASCNSLVIKIYIVPQYNPNRLYYRNYWH